MALTKGVTMTEYADQRAHDVFWMTAEERDELNPQGQPFTLSHRLILDEEPHGMVRPRCACGNWGMVGFVQVPMAHIFFAGHCNSSAS